MVTGPALRGELGEGHDHPPGQGPRVRDGVRAGIRQGPPPEPHGPAESSRAGQVARLRAARRRAHPAMLARMVGELPPGDRERYQKEAEELSTLAAHLNERASAAPAPTALPAAVSVSDVAEYARCPKRFYWSVVRPLPRFSGPAARIGSQVHAWIERQSSGQASLLELDEAPDLTAEDLAGEPGRVERLQQAFLSSRFAGHVPLYAERPFLLHVDGHVVGGRIDAVYGTAEGPWEVVDYKTGKVP